MNIQQFSIIAQMKTYFDNWLNFLTIKYVFLNRYTDKQNYLDI